MKYQLRVLLITITAFAIAMPYLEPYVMSAIKYFSKDSADVDRPYIPIPANHRLVDLHVHNNSGTRKIVAGDLVDVILTVQSSIQNQ